jgi:LysR family cyn operon transcriptional activator
MELRQLRYFVTLAEELSFTRAAERMHVTQSTLSHQIKQIEDEIGQRLFDRIGKRVVITDAGEALLPNATRALREVDEGLRALTTAPDPLVGTLTIGATHTFNIELIPDCLATFLDTSAVNVVVEMFATDVVTWKRGARPRTTTTRSGGSDPCISRSGPRDRGQSPVCARKRVRMVELHKQRVVLPTRSKSTRRILDDGAVVGAEPVIVAEIVPSRPRSSWSGGLVGRHHLRPRARREGSADCCVESDAAAHSRPSREAGRPVRRCGHSSGSCRKVHHQQVTRVSG